MSTKTTSWRGREERAASEGSVADHIPSGNARALSDGASEGGLPDVLLPEGHALIMLGGYDGLHLLQEVTKYSFARNVWDTQPSSRLKSD